MCCLKETNKSPKASAVEPGAACKTSFISLKNRFTFKLNNPIYESVGTNV